MNAGEWKGRHLGERTVAYRERDAILYALAVGAPATSLELVFEDRLRVLPTFGLTLAQWAPDVLADAGVFDHRSVHGAQSLDMHEPLARSGELLISARVGDVSDKGTAAVFEVIVECRAFTAVWSVFAPGLGGFGGERGPARAPAAEHQELRVAPVHTFPTQAALYRLTGDEHRIHIDPEASARIGHARPILQGLCTLAAATLVAAELEGAHPADLQHLEGRFVGAVYPGDTLQLQLAAGGEFAVQAHDAPVITEGRVVFA